ncbi:MAG TPA: tetratricopeptide repeat protein [Candidatus Obscuribacterales bacterium]
MIDPQTVDGLLEQAYNLIRQGQSEQAVAVGNELLKNRHARGFEIIALAFEQQGNATDAIAVLQDGVSRVPNAWPLWELLGNLYSDQGQYDEAYQAYDKALACPNGDHDSINYNYAILLKRLGKLEEAMKLSERIRAGDLEMKVRVLQLSIFNAMKRHDEAARIGTQLIQRILTRNQIAEEEMGDLSRTYAEVGRAHWEGKSDRQSAWENAWKALEWDRSDNNALWLVREIINRKSNGSKWFKLVIEGRWHFAIEPNKPIPSFVTTYEVVADSPEDALNFAKDLEPMEVRSSMKIDHHEDLGNFPENQQGVYWRSAYGFYS